MVINISIQHNGGFLPDIILLTQGYYNTILSRGTGEPPHLILGHGITRCKKGVVDLWPRG